jgi:hypothetical protein
MTLIEKLPKMHPYFKKYNSLQVGILFQNASVKTRSILEARADQLLKK